MRGWPGSSGRPVRTLRDDVIVHAASERQARLVARRDRPAAGGLWLGAQRAQDPHRVLQGLDRRGLSRARVVSFPWVYVPPPAAEEPLGGLFVSFPPAVVRRRAKRIRRDDPPLAVHRWTGQTLTTWHGYQSRCPGWINYYGRFYRSVLIRPSDGSTSTWCVGPARIQTAAPLSRQGAQVPGRRLPTRTRTVRPLAVRRAPRRLDDGSRMIERLTSGSASAGGCDSPRRLTRQRWGWSRGDAYSRSRDTARCLVALIVVCVPRCPRGEWSSPSGSWFAYGGRAGASSAPR